MSERHLKQGDPLPPLAKDTLRIYSMRYCPHAQRTRLVLAHKKIPYEEVNINLAAKPDWFLAKTPVGTVPLLELNDKILWESIVCNEYLEDIYPGCQLISQDFYERARHKILYERWGKVAAAYFHLSRNAEDKDQKEQLFKNLKVFEDELEGKKYYAGENVGMVDFNIWPHLERIHSLFTGGLNDVFKDYKTRYPRMAAYIDRMLEEPAVKATREQPSTMLKFYTGYIAGKPQYDDL